MTTVTIEAASALGLERLLDTIATGEEIAVTKEGRTVARIVPECAPATATKKLSLDDALALMHRIRETNGSLGSDPKVLAHEGHLY